MRMRKKADGSRDRRDTIIDLTKHTIVWWRTSCVNRTKNSLSIELISIDFFPFDGSPIYFPFDYSSPNR